MLIYSQKFSIKKSRLTLLNYGSSKFCVNFISSVTIICFEPQKMWEKCGVKKYYALPPWLECMGMCSHSKFGSVKVRIKKNNKEKVNPNTAKSKCLSPSSSSSSSCYYCKIILYNPINFRNFRIVIRNHNKSNENTNTQSFNITNNSFSFLQHCTTEKNIYQ